MGKKAKPADSPVQDSGAAQQPTDAPRAEMANEIQALLQTIHDSVSSAETSIGKLTPDQINAVIAQTESRSQRRWEAEKFTLLLLASAVVLGLAAVCFLWWISLHYEKPDLVADLIKMIVGLLGGLLGGYGLRGVVERKAKLKPRV